MTKSMDLVGMVNATTKAYIEFCKNVTDFDPPKEGFKFICEKPDGRVHNFSLGDRIYWYLLNGESVAFNGQTGIGKSQLVNYFAWEEQRHFRSRIISGRDTKKSLLTNPVQIIDNGREKLVTYPAEIVECLVYGGIFLLEEAANSGDRLMTEFNNIIRGDPDSFNTHLGAVNLPWNLLQFLIAGNFHDKRPPWPPAERYRFVWVEVPAPKHDVANTIDLGRAYLEEGFGPHPEMDTYNLRDDLVLRQRSRAYLDTVVPVINGLCEDLRALVTANRRRSRVENLTLRERIPWYLGGKNQKSVAGVEGMVTPGTRWRAAPDLPQTLNHRARRLLHPAMTFDDYLKVLEDIYVNPAIATQALPYSNQVEKFRRDCEIIFKQHLESKFDDIRMVS